MQLPPPSYHEQPCGEKLFVGNLPFDATDAELWNLFGAFGPVVEIVILGAGRSQSGQGCAFVKFAYTSSTAEAISRLDGKAALRESGPNAGALLEVRIAKASQPTSAAPSDTRKGSAYQPKLSGGLVRLFVGNLPLDVTTNDLVELFKSVNIDIVADETFLMTGRIHQNNAVCAFVVVNNGDDATKAMKEIDNRIRLRPNSLVIRVKLANEAPNKSKRSWPESIQHSYVPVSSEDKYTSPCWEPPYDYANSKEPSIRTYHPYMMMPQSMHYGPLNIIPGDEPWRNDGIYSLTFTRPFMGQ